MSIPNPAALQVLRVTQQHHVQMGAMADQKACSLLAASLITLALSFPQAVHDPNQYTLIALSLSSLVTSIMCILALTPRMLVLSEPDSKPELNLLFCGHFTSLDEEDYVSRVKKTLETEDGAQDALARDIFQMGLVLHQKKFRHLASAYTVCIGGLIVTTVVAVISPFIR